MFKKKSESTASGAHCLLKDVGVNSINRQHLRLASYAVEFNQIIENLEGREPEEQEWRRIDSLFAKVTRYVESHFREEEQLMIENGYPDYESHKALHDNFVAGLIKVQSSINNRKISANKKFGTMLWDWLIQHINQEDYKYREFFQSKGLS